MRRKHRNRQEQSSFLKNRIILFCVNSLYILLNKSTINTAGTIPETLTIIWIICISVIIGMRKKGKKADPMGNEKRGLSPPQTSRKSVSMGFVLDARYFQDRKNTIAAVDTSMYRDQENEPCGF